MDGNGRWAKQHHFGRIRGHKAGIRSIRSVTKAASRLGVHYLTLYAFSTENWNRPKDEVDALMHLFVETIEKEIPTLNKNNIRLSAIGDIESLPEENRTKLHNTIDQTAKNDGMTLILALSYSGRWEITDAVKKIIRDQKAGKIQSDAINDALFSSYLQTAAIPDPELLIRTSGEERISNFLLWQIAYSELYFTPKLWPDFGEKDFYRAILDYQKRERRFGLTSEQLKFEERNED
jgi:undecaprenyl diphosphate synthase